MTLLIILLKILLVIWVLAGLVSSYLCRWPTKLEWTEIRNFLAGIITIPFYLGICAVLLLALLLDGLIKFWPRPEITLQSEGER